MNERQDWPGLEFAGGFIQGLVSVIIPTYNRAAFLPATLDSVIAQHYRPIEIQLVDDGSTDGTYELVAEFFENHCRRDDGLSLVLHRRTHSGTTSGASSARNIGLRNSRGEFIQFLDSDDVLHPDKLAMQVSVLQSHQVDFVWSSTIAYQGVPDWSSPPMIGAAMQGTHGLDFITPFIRKSCWRTESGLHRRTTCAKTGPWRSLPMFQDWEYHIRMLAWNPRIRFVEGNFAAANQHDQGRIGDKWRDGTGLDGALNAILLAEEHTRSQFQMDDQWRRSLQTRYLEVAERADLLKLADVAARAREIVSARS